jgi:crotonobetainyl-CoA:carnitine CoA-transferase CaiB-like acyl-CoA transferase
VPYGTLFKTKDSKDLILAVGDDRQFRNLCEVLNEPELAENPDYRTNSSRVKNRIVLVEKLRNRISGFESESLLQALLQKHVPAGIVKDVAEALDTEEAKALRLTGRDGLKGLKTVAFTLENINPENKISNPPHFGEHTSEVVNAFKSAGYGKMNGLTDKSHKS